MKTIRTLSLALTMAACFLLSAPTAESAGFSLVKGSVVTTTISFFGFEITITTRKVTCVPEGTTCHLDRNGNFVPLG